MDNKNIFAANLKRYMESNNKTRREVCESIGVSYYTFSDWVNGKKYPRMDKVEMLASYFGIQKSDLIEEKMTNEKEKDNALLTKIIVRLRSDNDFLFAVKTMYKLDAEKMKKVSDMLNAFQE